MKWMRWMLIAIVCFTSSLSAQDCPINPDTFDPCMCQPDSDKACNGCGNCNAPWQVGAGELFHLRHRSRYWGTGLMHRGRTVSDPSMPTTNTGWAGML